MKFKLTNDILNYMHAFSGVTHARIKDCFVFNDLIYFIVEEGDGGRSIGVKGAFVKEVSRRLNKPIKVVEFSSDPVTFIKNILLPIKAEEVKLEDSLIVISDSDHMKKSKMFGREKSNFELMNALISRYYHNKYKLEIK